MNFVKHLKDIENKLFRKDRYGGCYVYSRDKTDPTYKLGMSEVNLFGRVKTAKSCYPFRSEFWLHILVVCHDKSKIRTLESKLLKESKYLKKVEKEECSCEGEAACSCETKEQGLRPREYRIATSRDNLNTAIQHVLNENTKLWDLAVAFGENGWVIIENEGEKPVKSIGMLGPSESKSMESIEKTSPVKVGDKVYVVYTETEEGTPQISTQGKITQQLKHTFRVYWPNYNGNEWYGKYKFNEVYLTKKEAEFAKRYWYELNQ